MKVSPAVIILIKHLFADNDNTIIMQSTDEDTLLSETSGYICIIIALSLSVR